MLCRVDERTEHATRALAEALPGDARLVGSEESPREAQWRDDLRDSRGCLLEAGGQVDDALSAGTFPLLTAGHCSIALTTLPTVARPRPHPKVLPLDAHGDFNAPDTTPSGFLGGMPLAGACGAWDAGLGDGAVDPARVVVCGVRDLDAGGRDLAAGERALLARPPATVIGPTLETLVALQNALDGAPTYVHLDCDVLDP